MRLARRAVLGLAALMPFTAAAEPRQILHKEKSLYRDILVYDEDGLRCLKFGWRDPGRQSCIELKNPRRLVFEYTRMMLGALYLNASPEHVLIVGLGGGTLPEALRAVLPGIAIDVAEIDPAVTRMAGRYFSFQQDARLRVFEEDGRVFVKRAQHSPLRYDLVMLDAFNGQYIPEHLMTREFLEEVRSIMTPGGVLAANTFSSSKLYDYESLTYQTVFGSYFNLKSGNRVILTRLGALPSRAELAANAARLEERLRPLGTGSESLLPLFKIGASWPPGTRVLTDQYSPANLLNGPR